MFWNRNHLAKNTSGDHYLPSMKSTLSGSEHIPHILVDGAAVSTASLTRPANTTQYHAGDVVGQSPAVNLTFAGCARANGMGGLILGGSLLDEANQATKGQFELWLFSVAPAAVADHAAFAPSHAEMENRVGVLAFTDGVLVGLSGAGASGNALFEARNRDIEFECAAADTQLYGQLVVRNTYTPVSGEKFHVRLEIVQE